MELLELLDDVELVCVALAADTVERNRVYWVHPLNAQRITLGEFHCLYSDLRQFPDRFFNYYRMSIESFDELVILLRPYISETNSSFRETIGVEERLTVTLRYLVTGSRFSSLQHQFKIGRTTISQIVKNTCIQLWNVLQPIEMPTPTVTKWIEISKVFYEKTNFPNCLGAVDGKHIRIISPQRSGSNYFCYKKFFSIVLMAVVDANYCFTIVDVGSYGREGDTNIFKQSTFGKLLYNNSLNLPPLTNLPNTNGPALPYVLIGDEAFGIHQNLLRPYSSRDLNYSKRIFNYRLCRARRNVECAFGILCRKFEIFYGCIAVGPDFASIIVQAATVLHNYIRRRDGFAFEDILNCDNMLAIEPRGISSRSLLGQQVRDQFAQYFLSDVGSVPWQNNRI